MLYDGKEYCIVNGQHRYEAINNILHDPNVDVDFDREIIVNIHEVPSFSSTEANNIFIATNNIKNVKMSDNPKVKFQNICNRLKDHFPEGISDNRCGKGTGHRLDKKQLYNMMMYNDYFNNPEHSEEQLFEKVLELNKQESNKSFDEHFPRKRADKWKKKYDGAHKSRFYLGLKTTNQLAFLFQTHFK